MARLRYNGLTTTLGAALAAGDTTITFATALTSSAGAVPTISGGNTIPLSILNASGGVAEIVSLTAYTSGATTGTIARAQESTTAGTHASGASVVHAPTAADFSTVPFVRVYRTTNYTLPSAATTAIPYDNEADDTHGFHDNATNPTRLTVPAGMGGVYSISLTTEIGNNNAEARTAHVRLNGGPFIGIATVTPAGSGVAVRPAVSAITRLAPGDYIEALSNPGTGSSGTHYAAISNSSANGYLYFSMARLGE